jgi:ElaB/YqjD/DUF883 family membrane-anchored ribosome-binding protein
LNTRAQAASDEIREGLEELIGSAESLLLELQDQKTAVADSLRKRAAATIKSARRRLAQLQPDVQELATKTYRGTVTFVRQDPWRAVALGALFALAIGLLVRAGAGED